MMLFLMNSETSHFAANIGHWPASFHTHSLSWLRLIIWIPSKNWFNLNFRRIELLVYGTSMVKSHASGEALGRNSILY